MKWRKTANDTPDAPTATAIKKTTARFYTPKTLSRHCLRQENTVRLQSNLGLHTNARARFRELSSNDEPTQGQAGMTRPRHVASGETRHAGRDAEGSSETCSEIVSDMVNDAAATVRRRRIFVA